MNETALDNPLAARRQDRIRTVTNRSFSLLVLEQIGPVAVEFMSYGCEHCRLLEPVLQKVAELVGSSEQIFRVNIGVEEELAARYQVNGTPTLIMFLNGDEVGRAEGPHPSLAGLLAAVTKPFER